IHKIFELDNSKGLSTYLAGASDLNNFQKEDLPYLSIITSGPIPPNPSELLGSEKMRQLIKVTKDKFDFVIFDSPPVLMFTDSLILSKALDGTIVVTRGANTTYDSLAKGLKSLDDIKAHILGMVINAVDVKKDHYYYYHYDYNYDYYYAPESAKKKSHKVGRAA
ncbi:MAG: CpsD/CapB family tyrosine-protein kinase, partial [Chloroflexota bacterium]